jgi:hypothetical protein
MIDLEALAIPELLELYAAVLVRLRSSGVCRTENNPVGDLSEWLFCSAFCWALEGNSSRDFDALGNDGTRYQIKGRRLTESNPSRQLSAIRDLAGEHFDYLAAVLFAEDFSVDRAAIVPHAVVARIAPVAHRTNSHTFVLRDSVWATPGARDVTPEIRAVFARGASGR